MERDQRQSKMQNQQSQQQKPGLQCPVCKNFIPLSIIQILESSSVSCPSCGLRLDINKTVSAKALEALKKVAEAQKDAESASTFDGTK